MNRAELEAFEAWLLKAYQYDNSVPFAIIAQALKQVRANAR